ncbi:hypothetical protein CPB84DRAFT_451414 [Gymnopilus junonius]|uniref:Hyaluronan/mRNA-binding protein domain-containing protein n=1 Tax=Gymnopilus junonius TaxID=109634 RepID=A0A9P5TUA8_GYMJU|nr:hypothetical protein CPB84DRAFT_451414 [Gymnopilus junonius]
MSVATKNPFALLDEDDSGVAPAVVAQQEPTPAPAPAARTTTNQKSRGGPASRGGKYYARGGKPAAKDTTPATEETEGQKKSEGREGREGGRGRGRGRGGPRGRGRPFDRHSQTGKTDSEKKIHQSWGGDDGNTEFKQEQAAVVDATVEATNNDWGGEVAAADWGAPAPDSSAVVDAWAVGAADAAAPEETKAEGRGRREREPEEDDNTLTLEQYLAQQKEKETAVPKIEGTRQANDGVDDVFKDAVPLSKGDEDAYFVGKTKSAPKTRAKKEEKVYLEIDARFERPDRGGRGRGRGGDRGDRRGGRGRGGARGGRQNGTGAPVVNVDDQTAFPSLS